MDVGADRLHVVCLGPAHSLANTVVLDPTDHAGVDEWWASLPPGSVIAIDGPPGPSDQPFRDDLTVSPKFRFARGCEVELGRQRGIWVSFATGPNPLTGWMAVAAGVHRLSERYGHVPLETYPYAIYRTLLSRRPAKKTTALGTIERVHALRDAGMVHETLAMWSHDALDAAAAAVVARQYLDGTADAITCTVDNTSIWLPQPTARP